MLPVILDVHNGRGIRVRWIHTLQIYDAVDFRNHFFDKPNLTIFLPSNFDDVFCKKRRLSSFDCDEWQTIILTYQICVIVVWIE